MNFTEDDIKLAAKNLEISLDKYDMEQIKIGMTVELEHGSKNADKNLDVTNDSPEKTLQITLAHLEEIPDYYTKLLKYVEKPETDKIEERYKLQGFDSYNTELTEDGEGGPMPGAATLSSVSGMGAPVIAGRGITGSGDAPSPAFKKKKKKKRVKTFEQFLNK